MTKSEYLDFVENQFERCFTDKGYIREEPQKITSRIDDSVVFVGSSISTLKKYLLNNNIGSSGRYVVQNSLRTQALKRIYENVPTMFGSYFKSMGVLVEFSSLHKVVQDTFDYLINYLHIPHEDIHIKISSKDTDLIESIKDVDSRIVREFDTLAEKAYRHKYGLDDKGIYGRNFNIGIRKKNTNSFIDIGNVIIMESSEKKYAVEMGIGNCTLSLCEYGENSTIESSRMSDIIKINSAKEMKFADAVIAVSVMLNEKIREHADYSRHFSGIFKKYCEAIDYWQHEINISDETVLNYIESLFLLNIKSKLICLWGILK